MFTVGQLIAHGFGDYVFQSDWMANTKTKKSVACLAHVCTYLIPFLFLTQDPAALFLIAATHFVIDRWRLARYVIWVKNFWSPRTYKPHQILTAENRDPMRCNYSWGECQATGYGPETPPWMATWLMIIVDNLLHVTCNAMILAWVA